MTPDHDLALCIHAYYVGELDAGRRACERLLSRGDLPQETAQMVRSNRLWYTPRLDELVGTRFVRIDVEPAHDGWSLFNPTILAHDGRLLAIVRSSNYRIVDGQYVMPEADAGCIRTANLLVQFDAPLLHRSSRVIGDPEYGKTPYPVDGLEDCRLRHTKTGIGVSATVRNVAPFDGRCRIATADLDINAAAFRNLRVIASEACQEHEKNWMPILGKQAWLYACNRDGRVATVDADDQVPGGYQLLGRSPAPAVAREFRGGSQLVPWRDGHLALIHEVSFLADKRAYEHRFVWFDNRLRLAAVSQPFAFRETQAIEFAAGLAILGDRVVASFGVRDAEAWLVEIPAADVESILHDLPISCQSR